MMLSDPLALLLLLFSPFAGSFFGLVADRLPRGESMVLPRSHCRACGARLGLRDLVPMLSFLAARGRCRHCGAAIPPWLFYFEIVATGLGVFALLLAPSPALAWGYALFLWLLLTLAVGDVHHFRLPNFLTGALLVAALWLSWATGQPPLADALWGAGLGLGSFLALQVGYRLIRGREGLGMGDVKLIAGLGAALGPVHLPMMVFLAAVAALAAALVGNARAARRTTGTQALPFGAALAGACLFLWLRLRL